MTPIQPPVFACSLVSPSELRRDAGLPAPGPDFSMDIQSYLVAVKEEVDRYLDVLLPAEQTAPPTIHRAMRYSVFAGGKRVRPVLAVAAGESLGGDRGLLMQVAAAIEMLHTYSLIHDDLPALDNDDLRRGRPTCHKVFGDAMAILAGDALMTCAYQVLCRLPATDGTRLDLIRELSFATGTVDGMIGGQVVDIESEGKPVQAGTLEYIHSAKTGALLTACARCGAIAAGADEHCLRLLTDYGRKVGLAFQIVDDVLDVTLSSEELGKTAGKDEKVKKATFPALYGVERSLEKARELSAAAIDVTRELGEKAEPLRCLASFIVSRMG